MIKYICCCERDGSSQAPTSTQLQPPAGSDDIDPQDSSSASDPLSGVIFSWNEILAGTMNLRDDHLLGEGGFGRVYRCVFPMIRKEGAVKIQKLGREDGPSEFEAEITTLDGAKHNYVINLLGKCIDGDHRALIYECMPRGSLDRHLYDKCEALNWERRTKIAVGVANALKYVHTDLKKVHRDIKPANVLLDENFEPKLTDFGLAYKIVVDKDDVEQQSKTDTIKGTRGYIAPETEESGLFSSKSDVYSYGVFLLTLFSGRKVVDREELADWLKPVYNSNGEVNAVVEEYADTALGKRFSVEGLMRLFDVARTCMKPVEQRPDMELVCTMVSEAAACEVPESSSP